MWIYAWFASGTVHTNKMSLNISIRFLMDAWKLADLQLWKIYGMLGLTT